MPIKKVIYEKGVHRVPVKVYTDDLDEMAEAQLRTLGTLPFVHHHVAAMPDCHGGMGSTIGSVIPTKGAIIPAAVGVDLGCGMMAVKTNLSASDLPDNLHALRSVIESKVPHGRTDNGGPNDRGGWGNTPNHIMKYWSIYGVEAAIPDVLERHPGMMKGNVNGHRHLGTLGTGNHFIELCLDENQDVWVMLHSGSRGIGNRIGSYFIKAAKKEMERFFINLPSKDLSYFVEGTDHFDDYVKTVGWAQDFAAANRKIMMSAVIDSIEYSLKRPIVHMETAINCHHNYVEKERHYGENVWLTRKGAIRAREGDLGIIPGSMGAKSYIVEGLGNKESFCSCSHGAGRKMSRSEANKRFTAEDLAKQTEGIECRKDADVVDEIPSAYKDIDVVMENQSDLVRVKHTLKQVLNVKG
jgi:tRNA-splicing ligase RtcB